jgi:hypothetical protein
VSQAVMLVACFLWLVLFWLAGHRAPVLVFLRVVGRDGRVRLVLENSTACTLSMPIVLLLMSAAFWWWVLVMFLD